VRALSFTSWSGFGSIELSNCRSTDLVGTGPFAAIAPKKTRETTSSLCQDAVAAELNMPNATNPGGEAERFLSADHPSL
jgi:hypothetical protein